MELPNVFTVLVNCNDRAYESWTDKALAVCNKLPDAIIRLDQTKSVLNVRMLQRQLKNVGMIVPFDHKRVIDALVKDGSVIISQRNGKRYIVRHLSTDVFVTRRAGRIFCNMDSGRMYMYRGRSSRPRHVLVPRNVEDVAMLRGAVLSQQLFPVEQPTEEDCGDVTYGFSNLSFQSSSINKKIDVTFTEPVSSFSTLQSDMSRLGSRLGTFASNGIRPPQEMINRKSDLAKCGFYYTGEADLVRCYKCKIGFKDWKLEDDPLFFHLKLSPDCPHVNSEYDRDTILAYKSSIQNERDTRGGMRSPRYRDYTKRLESFTGWDRERPQTPIILAEAGFYYTGTGDTVRCFHCDGGLQQWEPEDEPWVEHAYWFPNCQFVKDTKGAEYIALVRRAAEEDSSDEEEDVINIGTVAEGIHEYHKPIFSPVAQGVIAAGFSKASVEMAIDVMSQQGKRLTKDAMIQFLVEKKERGEILPTDIPTNSSPAPEFDDSTEEGLLQQRDYYNSILLCIRCDERNCNVLFLPCGHHKMCTECSDDVQICPLCQKQVVEKVKTFMA